MVAGPALALESPYALGQIRTLQRLDINQGWALTDSELLWTSDGGATWINLTPARGFEGVSAAFFVDQRRGWLAGVDAQFSRTLVVQATMNGGRSWTQHRVAASTLADDVYSRAEVYFVDSDHGWLLGQVATSSAFSVGRLFRTIDGGTTWEPLPEPPAAGRLSFTGDLHGFMVGAPVAEKLYATDDGGRTWRTLELGRGAALYGVPVFRSALEGAVAVTLPGKAPQLLTFVTRDGGRSWAAGEALALPVGDYTEPLPAAIAADGQIVAVVVNGAVVLGSDLSRSTSVAGKLGGASVRELSFSGGFGWALVAEGICDAETCRQSTRMVGLDNIVLGGGPQDLLMRSVSEDRLTLETPGPMGVTTSFDKGFDKCAAATTGQMQTWKTYSPYKDANIYYGGSARACSQTNLSSSWISTVFSQGWRLIPTWVGPQAPCTTYGNKFSSNTTTARSQGLTEANSAVDTAAAYGLGAGTPLYYDLENYNETDATCYSAVRAFVNAWSEQVKARGYVAGVYGNAYDAQHDFRAGIIATPPDVLWAASWVCAGGTTSCSWTPTVWGIPGLSDSYWTNNQRIRQYWGGHNETFGGITFNIDSDYSNAPVASSGGGGGGGTFTCDDGDSCFTLYGPSQYWHLETLCSGTSVGTGGDLYWTYVNGTATSNYAQWKPNFAGTGGAGNYTVSVFIPRCFGTSQQAQYRIYHNGTNDYFTVNQNNAYDAWVTLGTYYFNNSGTEFVELADSTGEAYSTYRQISFDAVRFVK